MIPVIDIFAGPGGLGEGFSALTIDEESLFDVRLSIEKEEVACRTLFLRKFVDRAKTWVHFDIFAWTPSARPARPEGGECQTARALYALIKKRYGTA